MFFESDPFLALRPFPATPASHFQAHWHEIVFLFVFYTALHVVLPAFSRRFFPSYAKLDPKTKANFDIHNVSQVQAIILVCLVVPLWWHPNWYGNKDISGWCDFGGFVAAVTVGYFVWDVYVCIRYFHLFGVAFLGHAVAALYVFSLTLIPFCQPWLPGFLIFELSTPFVNFNWYASRLPKGTFAPWMVVANGLVLMAVFFVVRIVWGFRAIYLVLWSLYLRWDTLLAPAHVPVIVVGLNMFLNVLNVFWFLKMVKIARKQARGVKKE